MSSEKYVKLGPFCLNPWQWEILGCSPFYLIFIVGVLTFISTGALFILFPSTMLLAIGILSPLNVYYKTKKWIL